MPATRTPLPPVRGSARWLRPLVNGYGRVEIRSHTRRGPVTAEYDVQALEENNRVQGYALAKDDDEVYAVDVSWGPGQWSCDCADSTFRGRECNHARALYALLAKAGQLPEQGKPLALMNVA